MTQNLSQTLATQVRAVSGRPIAKATKMELWQGLSAAVVDQIADSWDATPDTPRVVKSITSPQSSSWDVLC